MANYVSGWMLAAGHAVVSLEIYLTGKIQKRSDTYRRSGGKIIVSINGARMSTGFSPSFDQDIRAFSRSVANFACWKFKELVRGNQAFKEYSEQTLKHLLRASGIA